MMPLVSNTQLSVPTQPTFVATAIPGSNAVRPAFNAVPPSVSNAAVNNDSKGTGGYAGSATVSAPAQAAAPAILSTPIPAAISTSTASLNASAMFAAQTLAQDGSSAPVLFAAYEQMVAASLVKYKPSNAALPQPEVGGMFAQMLKEQKGQGPQPLAQAMAQASKEEAPTQNPAPIMQAPSPKPAAAKDSPRTSASVRNEMIVAASAYRATSTRNSAELSQDKVDAIAG